MKDAELRMCLIKSLSNHQDFVGALRIARSRDDQTYQECLEYLRYDWAETYKVNGAPVAVPAASAEAQIFERRSIPPPGRLPGRTPRRRTPGFPMTTSPTPAHKSSPTKARAMAKAGRAAKEKVARAARAARAASPSDGATGAGKSTPVSAGCPDCGEHGHKQGFWKCLKPHTELASAKPSQPGI